jgi:RimJ/RimL family protein N-acetyltransferase
MNKVSLRKLKKLDKQYFAKWWRDKDLIALTSGNFEPISDKQVEKYFFNILNDKKAFHFMIIVNDEVIGHISLSKKRGLWYETQVIIGEKAFWSKGYGTEAIKLIINKARQLNIPKIYLEVRPDNIRAIKAYTKSGFFLKVKKYYPKNKNLPETTRMELPINHYITGNKSKFKIVKTF